MSKLERYEEAVKAYNRTIRLDRDDVGAYRSKADALEKWGHYEEALVAYEEALAAHDKALQSEPNDFFLHFFRADILKHLGRYEEANVACDRAKQLAPYPIMAVYCIFAKVDIKQVNEAKARLRADSKKINEETIQAEIKLMHKEKELNALKSSPLYRPVCQLMQEKQEWSGTAKQFKEILCMQFPDQLANWYRAPRKFVEELTKIVPALQEEGIEVTVPPETSLVTLTRGKG